MEVMMIRWTARDGRRISEKEKQEMKSRKELETNQKTFCFILSFE